MSLLQRLKFSRIKSLYFAVFLAMVTTLSLSFLIFQTSRPACKESTSIPSMIASTNSS